MADLGSFPANTRPQRLKALDAMQVEPNDILAGTVLKSQSGLYRPLLAVCGS
ncbi:hypothetical protein PACF725_2938 [Pseudomonas aeruginosa]|nr:hypothetical protein PACF725_2938 [Pseudomonas aeruginosa]